MEPKELLDNLSTHLKNAIARAISIATSMGHTEVGMPHLLFGLLEEQGAVASEILRKYKVERTYLLDALAALPSSIGNDPGPTLVPTIPELDASSKKSLERAMLIAYEREHNYIGSEHLLHGLLQEQHPFIKQMYADLGINKSALIEQIDSILDSTARFPDIEDVSEVLDGLQSMIEQPQLPTLEQPESFPVEKQTKKKSGKQQPKALGLFAVELTDKVRQNDIDPVIGRATEIERLIHILSRRTKNNPVLVGEPGVGKTAIGE